MEATTSAHVDCAVEELNHRPSTRPPAYVGLSLWGIILVVCDYDYLAGSGRAAAAALRGWRRVVLDDDHLGRPIVSFFLELRRHIVSFWSDIATAAASPLLRGRRYGGVVRRLKRQVSLPCAVSLRPIKAVTDSVNAI